MFNRLNGKRYHSAATQKTTSAAEGSTEAHEENVRFVYEGKDHSTVRGGGGVSGSEVNGQTANPDVNRLSVRPPRSETVRVKQDLAVWRLALVPLWLTAHVC